jgi:transcriptional regulator with XRE-family HTH domain
VTRPRDADAAFTTNLKRLRAAQHLTMRDLASRCGFAHSVIQRIEDGQPATLGFAAAVAAGLGTSLASMLGPGPCETCFGRPPAGFACMSCGNEAVSTARKQQQRGEGS